MKFLEELDLEEGKTLTIDCPVCKGKKKFTATRVDDMILYNCYRNSCTVKGVKKVGRTVEGIRKKMNGQSVVKRVSEFAIPEYFSKPRASSNPVMGLPSFREFVRVSLNVLYAG